MASHRSSFLYILNCTAAAEECDNGAVAALLVLVLPSKSPLALHVGILPPLFTYAFASLWCFCARNLFNAHMIVHAGDKAGVIVD